MIELLFTKGNKIPAAIYQYVDCLHYIPPLCVIIVSTQFKNISIHLEICFRRNKAKTAVNFILNKLLKLHYAD